MEWINIVNTIAVVNKAAMVIVKSKTPVISVNKLITCYHSDYRNNGNFGNKGSHGNFCKEFSHECV